MAPTDQPDQPDQPESPPAEKPAEETPATPAAAPAPARPPGRPGFRMKRRTNGPDKFQDVQERKKPAFDMAPQRNEPTARLPRSRVLDPRLVPLVPPGATNDPSRQFHALLGLPRTGTTGPLKAATSPSPPLPKPKELPPGIDKVLQTLPAARAQIIRQVLTGPESRLQRALTAFIVEERFQKLDFESQRRALAAFDLRY